MHSLLDHFEATCARSADRLAAADQAARLDYKSFRAVAAGLGERVAAATERPHVGILAPTSAGGAVALFACWYAGRIPVPLNFLLSPDELAKIVRDAGLDLVLTIEHFLPAVQAAGLNPLLLNGESLVPSPAPAPDARPDDLAVILYTSGTSGDPKGVCLTFENLVRNATACIEHAQIDPSQVFLSVLPQFHAFGLTAMTITPLLLGATAYYLPRFSPTALVDAIAERSVSVFMAIPSMYAALANMKLVGKEAFASLRLAISGGEPLPTKVAAAFQQRFGVTLLEGYGLTETSPVVSLNTPTAHRPGSVGQPLPGVTVAAVGERGRPVPTGQDGELIIRGHCVMRGYHNKPAATAAVLKEGWLWTGDIGRIDADGFVYVTGRAKDMMIIGGENVFPIEIERVLADHPAVAEAAVVGVRDDVRGELPLAFAILKEGATADAAELRNFCRQRLAGYKVPREVRIVPDLPRGPTGKVLKRALLAPLP